MSVKKMSERKPINIIQKIIFDFSKNFIKFFQRIKHNFIEFIKFLFFDHEQFDQNQQQQQQEQQQEQQEFQFHQEELKNYDEPSKQVQKVTENLMKITEDSQQDQQAKQTIANLIKFTEELQLTDILQFQNQDQLKLHKKLPNIQENPAEDQTSEVEPEQREFIRESNEEPPSKKIKYDLYESKPNQFLKDLHMKLIQKELNSRFKNKDIQENKNIHEIHSQSSLTSIDLSRTPTPVFEEQQKNICSLAAINGSRSTSPTEGFVLVE